jgi:beta-glucosidase-like glycosyl hydrolase
MVSYTAINDIAMTINPILLSGMLKEEMGFDGKQSFFLNI